MRLCSKSASCSRIPVFSIGAVFFKKAAIAIAIDGQKTLQRQLSKVLSGMYNCNFEAINQVICTIILYLILCIRFRKERLY